MSDIKLLDDRVEIRFSLADRLLGFDGKLDIPYAHITNAYVSGFEDLELQYNIKGMNLGFYKSIGVFANPEGLIFVDAAGDSDCLVLETRGERYPRIAVELKSSEDPNAVAHEIMRRLPDSGPVE